MTIFREETTSALAGFHVNVGPLSWSNWNLERWFLWRDENQRTQRKTLAARSQQSQPTYGTGPESNLGHTRGR